MKRKLIAIAAGTLLALPALANNEIDAGNLPPNVTPSMTRDQVRAELVAAQRAGLWVVNAELGTLARAPVMLAGKTRAQVLAELVDAHRSGEMIVNAELGLTAREVFPTFYADAARGEMRAQLKRDAK